MTLVLSKIRHDQTKDYAGTIIGFIEKFCQNRQLPAMAGIMENKSQMKRRIAMIANYRKSPKKITFAAIVMLLVTGFIFYTLTGFAQESQGNKITISDEAKMALVEAQKAVENKDYVTARKFLTDYLATNPEDVPAQAYLSLGYYWYSDDTQKVEKKDNLKEAEKIFKQGYDKFPDNLNLLQYYAATLYELEDFTKAGPMMEKIYEADPKKNPRYLEAAAGAYYQVQDLVNDERVVNELIALPGDPKPNWINMLYSIYKEQGDQDSAIETLETYLNMPGAAKNAWLKELVTDYNQQGNKEKAAEYSKLLQDMNGASEAISPEGHN